MQRLEEAWRLDEEERRQWQEIMSYEPKHPGEDLPVPLQVGLQNLAQRNRTLQRSRHSACAAGTVLESSRRKVDATISSLAAGDVRTPCQVMVQRIVSSCQLSHLGCT